jgi:hypothetical protein
MAEAALIARRVPAVVIPAAAGTPEAEVIASSARIDSRKLVFEQGKVL